ncbi:endolytic transglycosylase MltG [Sansalvadorimonas sp. 2012CJ34-2]|uniref:Endolytic murein transglycosylase n=1 Tax=Parendozoicomonas callyspongiae TaxID=2942213 RepID=A0ABT0PBL6_9GAMM|nr:endolytic transglycosylase MltG [Sansalvadorimonas sp. 2012CJ34-2]MCL6268760.1 endolytic transglycosylase MltG [Sansalvadorimonas sp. 2012CJ34-2]
MAKRYLKYLSLLLTFIIVSAGGVLLYMQNWLEHPVVKNESVVFVVPAGASFSLVTRELAEQGLVEQPFLFKVYARLSGKDTGLKAGEYLIPAGTTLIGLVDHLSSGDVIQHEITLVEGRTLEENLSFMKGRRLKASVEALEDAELKALLTVKAPTAEGLFFSDTYYYQAGDTDLSILKRAHEQLNEVLKEEWEKRQKNLPYQTPYEALIMASILERETAVAEERPEIAGVFVRRLQKGMRLQSDPTVIYGMGDRYQGKIGRRDLRERTPYNTYRIRGLPPTPIALVGREAIHAALNPKPGSSLYFVARGDGTHVFSDTLAQHNRAVRKYQLNRREDYRSTPLAADDRD